MKLIDLFTPEEFAEWYRKRFSYEGYKLSKTDEEMLDSALPYLYALDSEGFNIHQRTAIIATFASIDELIREKTGESKHIN